MTARALGCRAAWPAQGAFAALAPCLLPILAIRRYR